MDCKSNYNRLSFISNISNIKQDSNNRLKKGVIIILIIIFLCCVLLITTNKYNIVNALVTKASCKKQIISADNNTNDCQLDVQYKINNVQIKNKLPYQSDVEIKEGDNVALVYNNDDITEISQLPLDNETYSVILSCLCVILISIIIILIFMKNKM